MRSEAQKRADKAHLVKLRRIPFNLNREDPSDKQLIDHLESQKNMTAYLKDLIKMDIERNGI